MRTNKYALSQGIIQELVTPEVALEPPNVQTIRAVQTVDARQLDVESNLVALIVHAITIHCLMARVSLHGSQFLTRAIGDGMWIDAGIGVVRGWMVQAAT